MSEEQAVYETEVSDAMEMLGAGYDVRPSWSSIYNKLFEIRRIAGMVSTQAHIGHLEREKSRLKASYQRNVKEINEHIKYLERRIETEGKRTS